MPSDLTPPPGAVFELAERAVDFVRRAVGIALDYSPETLPVLDHYLSQLVPRDQPALLELVASTAGAYFGEVVRRTIGGEWTGEDGPPDGWVVVLTVGLRIEPMAMAAAAIVQSEEGASFAVPDADRAAVEDALEGRDVPEDEYYSLSGRLEALLLVADVLVSRKATAPSSESS